MGPEGLGDHRADDPKVDGHLRPALRRNSARAHARSGDRIAIASYLGGGDSFDKAIARFAAAYADQNQRDYDALLAAGRDGRIEIETETE